jgi:hypothetical protein
MMYVGTLSSKDDDATIIINQELVTAYENGDEDKRRIEFHLSVEEIELRGIEDKCARMEKALKTKKAERRYCQGGVNASREEKKQTEDDADAQGTDDSAGKGRARQKDKRARSGRCCVRRGL